MPGRCEPGTSVIGIAENGSIICNPAPCPVLPEQPFTAFALLVPTQVPLISIEVWPGGTATYVAPDRKDCSITVSRPTGDITGSEGNGWSVSASGYVVTSTRFTTNCTATPSLSTPTATRPACVFGAIDPNTRSSSTYFVSTVPAPTL